MSHPIDDLFRKGLKNAPLDDHENDWREARIMLGLKPRKRRLALWLWIIGGAILLSSLAYYFSINLSNNRLQDVDILATQIIDESQTREAGKPLEFRNGDDTEGGSPSDHITGINEDHVEADNPINSSRALESDDGQDHGIEEVHLENVGASKIDNKAPGIPEQEIARVSSQQVNSLRTTSSESSLSEGQNLDLHVTTKDLGDEQILKLKGSKVAIDTENDVSEALTDGQLNQSKLGSDELASAKDKSIANQAIIDQTAIKKPSITLQPLTTLPFTYLELNDKPTAHLPGLSPMNSGIIIQKPDFGLYVGFSPTGSRGEAGVSLGWPIGETWGIDLGLGISRFSQKEDRTIDDVTFSNLFSSSSNGTIFSNNNFHYYSLRIPLRIHFRFNRHSVFSGGVLERPFLLNGRQEVSLSQEILDTASPGGPSFDPSSAMEPVTSVQNYNLNSVPQLERWIFYGQLGYQYQLSRRFSISLAGMVRLSDLESVSPLIDVSRVSQPTVKSERWHGVIRIDYRWR